jgi:hypothetical protein
MSTVSEKPTIPPADAPAIPYKDKPEGPISAAILAAGFGALVMGIITTISEASKNAADWLTFNEKVGPLSGKVIITICAWLVSWVGLHVALHRKQYETTRALIIALVLIALGVVGTYPTFFQSFEP